MLALINQFVYRPDASFAPSRFTPAQLRLAYEEVSLQTADQLELSAWFLPADEPHHLLLYCHGNAGNIRDWVHAAPPFVEAGVSLLIFDYRGYGRSQGRPSEEGLYLDGLAAWTWLKGRAEQAGLPAAVLGKSLGSAVGVHVAVQERPSCLVLDSAFTSMREVVAINAPWVPRAALPRLFESLERVPQVTCPTLVIHGDQDTLVPLEQGRRLYEALPEPRIMWVVEGAGHNDLTAFPAYHEQILAFLADPNGIAAGTNSAV